MSNVAKDSSFDRRVFKNEIIYNKIIRNDMSLLEMLLNLDTYQLTS